ncbi:heterokaryon incompatibility, partial [Bisporella sp. PMI_857]
RASITHASLSQNPSYEALSYCWGDAGITREIVVNSHPMQVTANLEAALKQLAEAESHSRLWVDALCINQADIKGRGEQILRMRDIYAKDQQVVV